jgi:hypothetical protein
VRLKKKKKRGMTYAEVKRSTKKFDSRWPKLQSEEDRIMCLINLLNAVEELREKVEELRTACAIRETIENGQVFGVGANC